MDGENIQGILGTSRCASSRVTSATDSSAERVDVVIFRLKAEATGS
jgi:hypothetical protein